MTPANNRAGRFVRQPAGYQAFIPAPLPPSPPVVLDGEIVALLSRADLALGRLDGIVKVVPDPDFFVAMYVRREAVLSSQIEGTQSTLEDLLEVELVPERERRHSDVGDIVGYIRAMNHGAMRLGTLPLSLRLIREIHAELLRDGRGGLATARVSDHGLWQVQVRAEEEECEQEIPLRGLEGSEASARNGSARSQLQA